MIKQMMLTVVGAMVLATGSLAFAGEGGKCCACREADKPCATQPCSVEKKGCGHCKQARPADCDQCEKCCEKCCEKAN